MDKEPSPEINNTLAKSTQGTENSNDSKGFNSANSNPSLNVDMKDSLAQKEKEISTLKQSINEKKQYQDDNCLELNPNQ